MWFHLIEQNDSFWPVARCWQTIHKSKQLCSVGSSTDCCATMYMSQLEVYLFLAEPLKYCIVYYNYWPWIWCAQGDCNNRGGIGCLISVLLFTIFTGSTELNCKYPTITLAGTYTSPGYEEGGSGGYFKQLSCSWQIQAPAGKVSDRNCHQSTLYQLWRFHSSSTPTDSDKP